MNGGIIVALWVSSAFGVLWADPLLALCIAIYVIKEAFEIGIRAYNNLMDKEMSDEDKARVMEIVDATEGIQGVHQLKTRYSGAKVFIQMHAEIDGTLSFAEAHDIADTLEHALEAAFPQAEVIIHQDLA
jgi:ferrous-iron efflux pump FieF